MSAREIKSYLQLFPYSIKFDVFRPRVPRMKLKYGAPVNSVNVSENLPSTI